MNFMKDRLLFDTNIICYAYDTNEPVKRKVCESLLEKVFVGDITGVVSNQILGEIFSASVTKLGVPPDEAELMVQSIIISERWEKLIYDQNTIRHAAANFRKFKAPFWDLVISETMKENDIEFIITENEKDFGKIPGIKVMNPFR